MKNLSILLLAITVSTTAFAQDYKYEVGIQGGPNITNIRETNQNTASIKPRLGFLAAIFFQYNLNKTFSLRIDPTFEQKGTKSNLIIPGQTSSNITAKNNSD
jgi:hypothetical protein